MVTEAEVNWGVSIAVSGAGCIASDGGQTAPHSGVGPSELLDGIGVGYLLTWVSVTGTGFGCAPTNAWSFEFRLVGGFPDERGAAAGVVVVT